MKKAAFILAVLIGLGGLMMGVFSKRVEALDKVVFSLNWTPQAQHVPFFAAMGKGFYEEQGINIDIQKGTGSTSTIQRIATGEASFGLASAVNLVSANAKGIENVRLIGAFFCNSPQLLVSLKKNNWIQPKDVAGKKVATTAFAALRQVLPIFLKRNNIKGDVELVTMDSGVIFQSLMSGKSDFADNYTPNLPSWTKLAKDARVELNTLALADFGVNHYDLALICSTDMMGKNPDLVRRFLKASYRGIQFTKQAPDEAVGLFIKYNPILDRESNKEGLTATFSLLEDSYTAKYGLGMLDSKKVQDTIDLMREGFNIEKVIKAQDLFTNKFLN